ncbi:MAG: poly-gamma-glutamate hydrolase family protein [Bdellovibrionales bacterium]
MPYQNFAELAATEREDLDYRILVNKRDSECSVLAIHGGKIEYQTSAIAAQIAGQRHSLYKFEGIKESGNFTNLHLSSHLFDEPKAVALVESCRICVTVHGFKERERNWVALGGLNDRLKDLIFVNLKETGLISQTEPNPTGRFPGLDPLNIVNRSQEKGVQIEISYRLRKQLGLIPTQMQIFGQAVRNAISEY